jgi:hypothetical protein
MCQSIHYPLHTPLPGGPSGALRRKVFRIACHNIPGMEKNIGLIEEKEWVILKKKIKNRAGAMMTVVGAKMVE